jgi:RNA-directed DNA polymerase
MKRAGNLFERVLERDNLRLAFSKALRGKRSRPEARAFGADLDHNLEEMARQLRADIFPVGQFVQFVIHDPKERVITAPCFRERVLHRAIMNVCEPLLERWLIGDTYACRKGKGRIVALLRAREFAARFPFFLKLDIRKYFDSIPHDRLLERLERRFKDRRLLALLARIVRTFRGTSGQGIPIGSLTSQHFANFYLGWFDRFVKETLRIPGYVRYMDDMGLWAETVTELKSALRQGEQKLRDELGLTLKPWPYLNRTAHGMDFLGCRVFPGYMTLNRRSRRRFHHNLLSLERAFAAGALEEGQLQQRATALVAFTRTAGVCSWRFRRSVLCAAAVDGHKARTG